ncbi:MAG: hypothetical protein Q8Q18_02390 [bacterium]|nr:hypothetical protein [bacterium]
MAKSTQYATPISLGCTISAAVGILLGLAFSNTLIIIFFLLPAVVYEIYRTQGVSTKIAAWGILIVFIFEIIFILFGIDLDLGAWLGRNAQTVYGYTVPLGDIKVVAPALVSVLSLLLFARTWGTYTKWLAVVTLLGSFAVVYTIEPAVFQQILKIGVNEALKEIR